MHQVPSRRVSAGGADAERVVNSPIVVAPSVDFASTPIGQSVNYLARVTVEDKSVESLNTNVLFMKGARTETYIYQY